MRERVELGPSRSTRILLGAMMLLVVIIGGLIVLAFMKW